MVQSRWSLVRDEAGNPSSYLVVKSDITEQKHFARLDLDAHEGSYFLITVSDTGVGIPPEIIDRIINGDSQTFEAIAPNQQFRL